jgi:transcriptional regulator with XRE-family HTH domain
MTTHLAEYFKERRIAKGLRLGQVAKLVGYTNLSKGARRIDTFERSGEIAADLLVKLAAALEIDRETVNGLCREDYRKWISINQPIVPYLVLRLLHGGPIRLPEEVGSVEAMEQYAIAVAKARHVDVGLVLSYRILIWFAGDGSIREVVELVPGKS